MTISASSSVRGLLVAGALAALSLGANGCGPQVIEPFTLAPQVDGGFPVSALCGADAGMSGPGGRVGGGGPQLPALLLQRAIEPPPPISGGTLLILRDGTTAVAADPDRDLVYLADLAATTLRTTVPLMHLDEPGRLAEDAAGRVHVALRRGGAVVTIDPVAGRILDRRAVCAAPRGIAYEARTDLVHVACMEGLLVSLPAAGGAPTRVLQLPGDLRDVVVDGDSLLVSRFRVADVLTISADGNLAATTLLPALNNFSVRFGQEFTPSTAWRMRGAAGGGAYVLHQRGTSSPIAAQPGGYGGGGVTCGDIVHTSMTAVHPGLPTVVSPPLLNATLAVDFALSSDELRWALIAAGNSYAEFRPALFVSDLGSAVGSVDLLPPCQMLPSIIQQPTGQAVAVSFDGNDRVVVQTREPATLQIPEQGISIVLSNVSRADTGHAIFHAAAGSSVACASCHAEGQEDGRVWNFACLGGRRTQSLAGGISGRAPYHWDGDLKDFPALVKEVYSGRMAGRTLTPEEMDATLRWIDSIPRPPSLVSDADTIARGGAIFHDGMRVGCANCHAGTMLTNDAVVDVGTGGRFKVPSLVGVGWRAPFLHNGCAATLADRFGSCGGGDMHGVTSGLSQADVADLVSYLQSL